MLSPGYNRPPSAEANRVLSSVCTAGRRRFISAEVSKINSQRPGMAVPAGWAPRWEMEKNSAHRAAQLLAVRGSFENWQPICHRAGLAKERAEAQRPDRRFSGAFVVFR